VDLISAELFPLGLQLAPNACSRIRGGSPVLFPGPNHGSTSASVSGAGPRGPAMAGASPSSSFGRWSISSIAWHARPVLSASIIVCRADERIVNALTRRDLFSIRPLQPARRAFAAVAGFDIFEAIDCQSVGCLVPTAPVPVNPRVPHTSTSHAEMIMTGLICEVYFRSQSISRATEQACLFEGFLRYPHTQWRVHT